MNKMKGNSLRKIWIFALALIMLFGATGAAFNVAASDDTSPVSTFDDGYELSANWIWADAEVHKEQWVSMRKTFTLDEVPEEAFARISADTKYWLWINGEMAINEGQLKLGDSRYTWYYDKEDISDYLVEGENTIAVQVYYAGKVSATTVNSTVPSFLFEAEIGDTLVCSDTTWKAVIDPAYEEHAMQEHGSLGEANIRYNAEKEMIDASGNRWTDKNFDDSTWTFAVNQDEKIKTNRIKNNDGGNNKIYYQNSDPRTKLVLRSVPQWYFGDLNKYTSDGKDESGIYTQEYKFAPLSLPGEYVVEAEIVVGTSNNAAIGICVCVKDQDNFYMPQISLKRSGSSAYDGLIFKPHTRISGSWKSSTTDLTNTDFGKTIYDSANAVDNRFETKHTVRIEVGASEIKTYMNGTLLGTVTNTSLTREGSSIGFRQDVDEILKVYSLKVTDTSGNEIYNANIDSYNAEEIVPDFSQLYIENSKNLSKVASNKIAVDDEGEKYVTVRNCRVGVNNGERNIIYTITNETNQQGTPYIKVKSDNGGETIDIVSDSWRLSSIRHQYVTKSGEQTWEPLGWMNGYVFTFTIPEDVEVLELGFRPSGYKTTATGYVETNNGILNQIYKEAFDTLYICMRDTYMDCPDRERSQWWGDTVSNMQQAAYAMDDNAALLYTKTLKQVIGFVKKDGALPSKVANGKDDLELPVQSLAGVHSFWQYYLYSGNEALIFEAYPFLMDYLDMWVVSANGVINHRSGDWDWIDWGNHPDITIIENCWYYIALDNVLKIANLEGSGATEEDIEFLTSRMERIATNFDAIYWNDSKNAYYYETDNGIADDRANALAVYSGLADKSRYDGILSVLTSVYNASPYMEKYVLESMYLIDAADEAIARTLKRYTSIAEDGYPTLPEYWSIDSNGTKNHAWTGGPMSMLYMYNAGITPITPEFKTFSVRPQLGTLTNISAYTEMGCGKIEVMATKAATSFVLTVVVPNGAESAIISVPRLEGIDTMIKLGESTLYADGRAVSALPTGISYVGEDANYVSFLVPSGEYTFTSSENVSEESDSYSFVIDSALNGAISVNGTEITSFPYTYTGAKDSTVTVVITPDENYRLSAITGSYPETLISSDAITRTYTLDGHKTFNAVFEESTDEYKTIDISISDKDMARYALSAYINGNLISLPSSCVQKQGDSVNLTLVSASDDNYNVKINGEDVDTIDFTVTDDTVISVDLEEKATVSKRVVSSVDVSNKSSNNTTWDETNLYDGIRVSESDSFGYSTTFSANTKSVSITYDFGIIQQVNQIALFPRTNESAEDPTLSCNYPTDFTVSVSTDGTNYTTVLTVTDNVNPKFKQQCFNFDKVYDARYVKLTVTEIGLPISGETSYYLQLAEFDVYYNSLISSNGASTINTTYGPIPSSEEGTENDKPFALFVPDSATETKFSCAGVFETWGDVAAAADDISGSVIYLRADASYDVSTPDTVFAGNFGTVTVDLNDHTITRIKGYLVNPYFKNTAEQTGNLIFKNGTIVKSSECTSSYGTFCINYASTNRALATFNMTFDNVRLINETTNNLLFQTFENGYTNNNTQGFKSTIVFNNCTIDSNGARVFVLRPTGNTSRNRADFDIIVNGGTMVFKDPLTESELYNKNSDDTITFGKYNGNYTEFVLPLDAPMPTVSINADSLIFVKSRDSETAITYTLMPADITKFAPKSSITLSNALIYNVYVPVNAALKSFTLNGVAYTDLAALTDIVTIDANNYYHFAIELPSAEAAKDIILEALITVDGKDYNGKWTMSIPKYAAKVLANGTDVEKTLAKDVLAYVKAAYNYFTEFNTAEEIARVNTLIDSIIGDYNAAPVSSGVTNTVAPITAVTLNLDAKPSIRFYVTDTNIEFYANGKKLDTVTGTDANGTYVELDVYAYALCETITYGDGGSYHISDFIKGAVGTEYEAIVKAFVKYTESAADYRNSVVSQ